MTYPMRTDVYGTGFKQFDMFGQPQGTLEMPMTAAEIEAELTRKLSELRGADMIPWDQREQQINMVMFPDLAARLPAATGAELVDAFFGELRRLNALG